MTKDWRDGICIGVFLGMLMCCALMLWFSKERTCEVSMGLHQGKETHVTYGVVYE